MHFDLVGKLNSLIILLALEEVKGFVRFLMGGSSQQQSGTTSYKNLSYECRVEEN